MGKGDDGWCILRTAAASTLRLVDTLRRAEIEAWSPRVTKSIRRPRSNTWTEREFAIIPSFVFVRAGFVGDVLRASKAWNSPHPKFSVFLHDRKVPIIGDASIERLRQEERRGVPKAKQRVFAAGDKVKYPEGGFKGLTGVVESGDGKATWVAFGGLLTVEIETWKLVDDAVAGASSDMDMAA